MEKVHWTDLTHREQQLFGDGCTFVPDFIFTANCRQHDLNYSRGGYLADKIKADFDMCSRMWSDSQIVSHYIITLIYYLGLTLLPFSYFFFVWGKYKTIEDILITDAMRKIDML